MAKKNTLATTATAPSVTDTSADRFIVSRTALLTLLATAYPLVPANPVVPILSNFLLSVANSHLTAVASDLETTMEVGPIQIEGPAALRIAVPARLTMELLKTLPDQPLVLTIDIDTFAIEIKSTNGRYRLAGEDAVNFPNVPPLKAPVRCQLPAALLARGLRATLPYASLDTLRPAMTGVFIHEAGGHLTLATTDGHRLGRWQGLKLGATLEGKAVVVPAKPATMLARALEETEAPLAVVLIDASNVRTELPGLALTIRIIDERYPDYANVVPLRNPNKLLIDRADLLATIKRVGLCSNKTTHQVRLGFAGSELQVSAEDLDFSSEASERLACQYEGDKMEIGFNARLLAQMLSAITTPEVVMEMSTPARAALVLPSEQEADENLLLLLMPIMLNNYV